ncbi:MAG: Ulp1 family isopeptidase [Alphaproteobacteria bacterium]|nr:Ulp1 family isopeptidase [Alphaproteobacteria bacterium]
MFKKFLVTLLCSGLYAAEQGDQLHKTMESEASITAPSCDGATLAQQGQMATCSVYAPERFSWDELVSLSKNNPIYREHDGLLLQFSIVNAQELVQAWPGPFQIISHQSFPNRVHLIGVADNRANYTIEKDFLGYGPYMFDVTIELTSNPVVGSAMPKKEAIKKNIFYAQALTNVGQRAIRKRLSPSELSIHIKAELPSTFAPSATTFNRGGAKIPHYRHDGQTIIAAPSHDLTNQELDQNAVKGAMSGSLRLQDILKRVAADFKNTESYSAFFPIATANGLSQHWTLLHVEKNKTSYLANYYDSMGPSRAAWYNHEPIIDAIQMALPEAVISLNFMGHQGIINHADCGFFVMTYMSFLRQGKALQNLSTTEVREAFPLLLEE